MASPLVTGEAGAGAEDPGGPGDRNEKENLNQPSVFFSSLFLKNYQLQKLEISGPVFCIIFTSKP